MGKGSMKQRWDLLVAIASNARDRVHPLDARPLAEQLGLSEEESVSAIAALERDGFVKYEAWGSSHLITITAEGERAVENNVGFEP